MKNDFLNLLADEAKLNDKQLLDEIIAFSEAINQIFAEKEPTPKKEEKPQSDDSIQAMCVQEGMKDDKMGFFLHTIDKNGTFVKPDEFIAFEGDFADVFQILKNTFKGETSCDDNCKCEEPCGDKCKCTQHVDPNLWFNDDFMGQLTCFDADDCCCKTYTTEEHSEKLPGSCDENYTNNETEEHVTDSILDWLVFYEEAQQAEQAINNEVVFDEMDALENENTIILNGEAYIKKSAEDKIREMMLHMLGYHVEEECTKDFNTVLCRLIDLHKQQHNSPEVQKFLQDFFSTLVLQCD